MVFAGDPDDPQKLVHNSGNLLTRPASAGRTWISDSMDNITVYPRPGMSNNGDPKIVAIANNSGGGAPGILSFFVIS